MKTSLPRNVIVGGIRYGIRCVKNLSSSEQKLDGHISYGRAIIEIDDDLDNQIAMETLWHEIIHAILIQAGQTATNKNDNAIDAMAYGIIQVIKDNPRLRRI